jgi:hypothetical protein
MQSDGTSQSLALTKPANQRELELLAMERIKQQLSHKLCRRVGGSSGVRAGAEQWRSARNGTWQSARSGENALQ